MTEDLEPSGRKGKRKAQRCLTAALLTGGGDRPYALGLAAALAAQGILLDFIGSDDLDLPEVYAIPGVTFRNLRGDQRPDVTHWKKIRRIVRYYARLISYTATARPRIFHILWNNKFEFLDRTALMLYYRLMRKKVVFTAHNVNARKRDSRDSRLNRLTLGAQYRLADHIFVHTEKMKQELTDGFDVPEKRVSVIPLGVNNTVPVTRLTRQQARERLGIRAGERVLLFFGRIAPYKGLDCLIAAFGEIAKAHRDFRLIIAGSIKECADYWEHLQEEISRRELRAFIIERIEFIPDGDTELFFKAADVLILPYVEIFQSGVLVLAYSFGLPVIAADVGSFREDIVEGETGYLFQPRDPVDLARAIQVYFSSGLYRELDQRRHRIQEYANDRYSWATVGEVTKRVYQSLLHEAGLQA